MKLRESFKKQLGLQETIMARMTEEEARALDEFVTSNGITLGPNGSDWLNRREARLFGLDDSTLAWLSVKAKADNKSPAPRTGEQKKGDLAWLRVDL